MKSANSDQKPHLTPGIIAERILLLENSNIGCDSGCLCRAFLATSLLPEQEALLKAHATKVVFDKIPSDAAVVREVLGETLTPLQGNVLDQLARDRGTLSPDEIKGGPDGASRAFRELLQEYGVGSILAALSPGKEASSHV